MDNSDVSLKTVLSRLIDTTGFMFLMGYSKIAYTLTMPVSNLLNVGKIR